MAQQENKIPFSKKGKREISPFIGHELLYDYLSGMLDEERSSAVADHVKYSRDAQLDLNKIQNGDAYASQLANTIVSQPIIEQINTTSTYLTTLMQKSNFDKWPQGLKWGLEALVVVAVIVSVLTIAPWQKLLNMGISTGSKEVVLAEVSKTETAQQPIEEKPQFVDEDAKTAKPLVTPTPKPAATAAKVPAAPAVPVKAVPTPAPSPTAVAKMEEEKSDIAPAGSGGFLFRGDIGVTNLAVVGPKITDKIIELGGRKAGGVELGWQKTSKSMYYHFTIPQAKYQELSNYLATYGKVHIGKEKHPRVMPDGIIRLILTVDEAKK
ncbi:hypothetical protein [Bdellovibrio svalbardensis]|uniref:LytR/CpsA/Psr regulator C-terminal domain-containing protein n=1 Tax=Bdellovibrio svalbardensis TaxID=2972972 RepID=A0ABT6DD24_9BACT|nr:hypothetical protein [Bdellovibrio svalbardensis]MDG0814754.1 hypothetical protein [Bdellovibrio svalbardensis]